ncbi:hypothetical protein BKA70DRAFT_1569603 [Coprinopsis sp. MPI-PUGE-AT-0042]|nr:hypothetical protein BKA70DRAFT_1569603 [Coprinopsis sp. MPI-PUGE-AT-0042]
MNDLNDKRSTEDHPLGYRVDPKDARVADSHRRRLRSRRATSTMFHRCEALEFNNCNFIYSGRDYHRFDVPLEAATAIPNFRTNPTVNY